MLSGHEIIKILSKMGFVHTRTRGSHAILSKETSEGKIVVPVPLHKELAKGTLKSIMRQVDLELEDLLALMGKK